MRLNLKNEGLSTRSNNPKTKSLPKTHSEKTTFKPRKPSQHIKMKYVLPVLVLATFPTLNILACECPSQSDTKEDFESEWNSVESVFELKIIEVLKEPEKDDFFGKRILKAEVLKVHKGQGISETIEIYSEADSGAGCHYPFKLGESYLFYGDQRKSDGYFHTTICHRTGKLSELSFDLKMIEEK